MTIEDAVLQLQSVGLLAVGALSLVGALQVALLGFLVASRPIR